MDIVKLFKSTNLTSQFSHATVTQDHCSRMTMLTSAAFAN